VVSEESRENPAHRGFNFLDVVLYFLSVKETSEEQEVLQKWGPCK
jgi:hypothetical protein